MKYVKSIQEKIAVWSFFAGIILAIFGICLPPLGVVDPTVISIVSELFILCGALLGIKANFDAKLGKFEAELLKRSGEQEEKKDTENQ